MDFYQGKLKGSWTITSFDRGIHRIDFKHTRGATIKGILFLVEGPLFRTICIEFNHPTAADVLPQVRTESIAMRGGSWACGGSLAQPSSPG